MEELTLVMLKPDCLQRDLTTEVINMIASQLPITILAYRRKMVDASEIIAHCEGLLNRIGSMKEPLLKKYVGKEVILLILRGQQVIDSVNHLIGYSDPRNASADSIRGKYCNDSFELADKEGRVVDNLIHSSDFMDSFYK